MKAHIELEYKVMINEDIYNKMLIHYDLNPIKQVNYYYSANKPYHAMRIREKEGKFIFTLKVRENNYHKEYEFEVKENNINDDKIQTLLKEFNIDNIEYIGSMTTYRAIKDYKYGELCIDKSEYLGQTDYEIEYELKDANIDDFRTFERILKENNLEYVPSKNSKFKRFLMALNKI